MNALLNIQVNVLSRQALADIRRMQAELARMQTVQNKGTAAANNFGGALANSTARIEKFGKNVQWSGRQLEYNFTLPLIIAGGMATKWALENEKAMTRVSKVYGDLGEDVGDELKAIERSFELLSARFGVHLREVMEIGAGWAQAGAAGVALSKATRATLEAMVIGEMNAVEATEKLIAVQSAYLLNTTELTAALAMLNSIENQTAITFDGLIDVITRAGGAAQNAGIDMLHLSAMAATLVPRAGSAAQAGNSLRTMISRLLAPTKQAAELLNELGLEIDGAAWQSKNGVQRLEELATAFDDLTQGQKAIVSSTVASRWQINRFDILMRDLKLSMDEATASQSAYYRALQAGGDPQRNAQVMAKELSIALSTNERSFAILINIIKNFMAEAIMPLLPTMVAVLKMVAQWVRSFTELSDGTKQAIVVGALFLALIGPLGRYVGSVAILVAQLGHVFHFLGGAIAKAAAFLFGWPGLIIAAIAAVVIFRDEIRNGLAAAFNALPSAIQGSLMTVLRMVRDFALAVYEWLSYLNPFARHSPSLVENVTNGIDVILAQYERLRGIESVLARAKAAQMAFSQATAGARNEFDLRKLNEDRENIKAAAPQTLPAFDSALQTARELEITLWGVAEALNTQTAIVERLDAEITADMESWDQAIHEVEMAEKQLRLEILQIPPAIAEVNAQIERQTQVVAALEREIDHLMQPWNEALAENEMAQNELRLEMLKNPPATDAATEAIKKQREELDRLQKSVELAMIPWNNSIFENELAQKRLRLEILKLNEAGEAVDDLRDRFAKLSGEIEKLRSDRSQLALSGAGSDVLATYDNQIAQLEAQRRALEGLPTTSTGGTATAGLEAQLEELRRQGEIMQLERDLMFDPQLHAVQTQRQLLPDAGTTPEDPRQAQMEELQRQAEIIQLERDIDMQPYLDQLEQEKDLLDELILRSEELNKPYEKRLEALQRELEILQLQKEITFADRLLQLEHEEAALNRIKEQYEDLRDVLSEINSMISDFASNAASEVSAREAAKKAADGASGIVEQFNNAGLGDYEIPAGTAPPGLGREGGIAEIEEFNKMLEAELNAALDAMPSLDLLAPFRDAWEKVKSWWNENVGPTVQDLWSRVTEAFKGGDFENPLGGLSDTLDGVLESLSGVIDGITRILGTLWDHIGPIFEDIFDFVVGVWINIGQTIWSELKNWGPVIGEGISAITSLLSGGFQGLVTVIQAVLLIIRGLWELFWPMLRNTLSAVWNTIANVIRGALEVIRGIFTMAFALFNGDWGRFWDGLLTVLDGVWDTVYAILRGAWDIIYGIVKGIVEGIVGFFQWLYDVLVGNSIIPDMVDAIIKVFNFLKDTVVTIWNALWKAVEWVWNNVVKPIWNAITWTIENVLVPVFEFLLKTVQTIWNAIGTVINWAWNNIIQPIWTAIKWTIDNVLIPVFEFLKRGVERIWNAIGTIISWAWNNVIKPIWDGIKWTIDNVLMPVFERLKTGMERIWGAISSVTSSVWNGIVSVLGSAVNMAIDVINKLIDGINLLSKLPGIDIHINHINHVTWGKVGAPKAVTGIPYGYASGTNRIPENPFARQVGGGFKTNNVRAIVGEGNPLYPEYVIPTDPNFRGRAMGLANMLLKDLGLNNFNELHPQYAGGGILGGAMDLVGDAWDATGGKVVSGIRKGAAMAIFGPVNEAAKFLISQIPVKLARDTANSIRETMYNWVKGTDDKIPVAPDLDGKSAMWLQMWRAVKDRFPNARLHSGYRPGSITATGNLSYHARGRAIDVTPSMDIFNWLHDNYGNSRELIFSPAKGRQIRNGAPHMYTGVVRNMHWDHVHWAMAQGGVIPSLANGGVVLPRPGGTVVRLAERGERELVTPLPRTLGMGNTYNFYGDLSFPNITSGDDAEELVRNLESLAD